MGGRQWRRVIAATLFISAVPQSGAQSPYGPVPAPALPDTTAASGWTITPDITVSETYNDNPGLAASGGERSDFITQVTPGQ